MERLVAGSDQRGRDRVRPVYVESDLWIKISKNERTIRVYKGDTLYRTLPADLAINFFSDKVRKGGQEKVDHWRTPEGVFYIVEKNPQSQFHKAFVLNYPGRVDAERGLRHELISRDEYNQIVRADERFQMPPMFTALGGYIEIHGDGTGARTNWTKGCVAIRNADIDELWGRSPYWYASSDREVELSRVSRTRYVLQIPDLNESRVDCVRGHLRRIAIPLSA